MSFKQTIDEIRETFRLMNEDSICLFGCVRFVKDEKIKGYLSSQESPVDDKDFCTTCHKKRYRGKKQSDDQQ